LRRGCWGAYGRCTWGESRCCSRGRRHRGARACALPRRQPLLTVALSVLSGYV